MTKVMFVVSGLGMGGAERVVALLSKAWAERGLEVTVTAFDSPDAPVAHQFADQVEIVRLGIPPGRGARMRGVLAVVRRWRALRRLLVERRPDLVISFLTKVNVLTLLASIGTDIPVIISERNNPLEQRAHRLWAWGWTKLAGRAAAIVLQTETIRSSYPADIANRADVIPNPVAIPQGIPRVWDGFILAAVGRLVEQKGFDLLIMAFGRIARDFPQWRLVIYGEGPDRAALECAVGKSGLDDRILLPGNTANQGDWIGQADAFVLSSRFEGFPNALVEAMMGRLPVVSFNCKFGPADIVSHGVNGLLVPSGDVGALASNLREVMENRDLRQSLGAAAAASASRFAIENIVAKWDGRRLAHPLRIVKSMF